MLRKLIRIAPLVLAAAMIPYKAAAEEPAAKQEEPPRFELHGNMGIHSGYYPSGFPLIDNPVIQGEMSLTRNYENGNCGLTLWGSYDTKAKTANEWDATAECSWKPKCFALNAGVAHYNFPHDPLDKLNIVFGKVELNVPSHPSLKYERFFNDGSGGITTFGIGHTFKKPLIEISASLIYNDGMLIDDSAFTHAKTVVGFPYEKKNGVTVKPSVGFIKAFGHDDFEDRVFGGIEFSF